MGRLGIVWGEMNIRLRCKPDLKRKLFLETYPEDDHSPSYFWCMRLQPAQAKKTLASAASPNYITQRSYSHTHIRPPIRGWRGRSRRRIMKPVRIIAVALLIAAVGADGCSPPKLCINGGGSTFVYPMMSKWAAEYDKAKGVEVNYQSIGSGGGIRQMIAQTSDFGCTDGPDERGTDRGGQDRGGDVVHIPLVMGTVVPAYNLAEVKEPLVSAARSSPTSTSARSRNGTTRPSRNSTRRSPCPTRISASSTAPTAAAPPTSGPTISPRSAPSGRRRWALARTVDLAVRDGAGQRRRGRPPGGIARRIGYVELTFALEHGLQFGLVQNKAGEAIKADVESITVAADDVPNGNPRCIPLSRSPIPAGSIRTPFAGRRGPSSTSISRRTKAASWWISSAGFSTTGKITPQASTTRSCPRRRRAGGDEAGFG